MKKITLKPIGTIYSPYKTKEEFPLDKSHRKDIKGTIEIFPQFIEGLKDLEGFSHIYLLFHFHLIENYKLKTIPPLDGKEHGVFATRSPSRPNFIGQTIVKLEKIEGNTLYIIGIDALNNTPLLDIKPYAPPYFEENEKIKLGWMEGLIKI